MAQENEEIKVAEQETISPNKKFKKPSLKVILISVIALLVLLLVIGISLIILTPKEEVVVEAPIQETNLATKEETIPEQSEPEVKFDLSSINSQKLNEQLEALTNKHIVNESYNIVENEETRRILEEQKRIEEESLKIEEAMVLKQKESLEEKKIELEIEMKKLEALKEEALLAKEELLKAQNTNLTPDKIFKEEDNRIENKQDEKQIENITQNKEVIEDETKATNSSDTAFLKLINVAKIKGTLYKKYLDKATNINPNIHLCRDDLNRIELYYGPFENNETREELLNKLIKNGFSQAYELEMTKEEFNKRCNY